MAMNKLLLESSKPYYKMEKVLSDFTVAMKAIEPLSDSAKRKELIRQIYDGLSDEDEYGHAIDFPAFEDLVR